MIKFLVLAFLSMVWGTTWIAIKYSLEGVPPFLGAMLRFLAAAICLYIYARARGISLRISRNDLKYLILSAIFLYLLDYGLIYWGEQYLYAGVTAIFFATFPLFTGVVSNFFYRNEPFRWITFAALLLGFLGVGIIFYDQLLITEFDGMIIWASAAIIFSALAAAISLVMVKVHLGHLSSVSLTLHQMLWGVLTLGVVGLLRGEVQHIALTPRAIGAVLYLGVFGSALAFVLYYALLKKMSAITLSYIIYITPVVALFAGWLLLDERISLRTVIGALVIFSGIGLSQLKLYSDRSAGRRVLPDDRR